MHRTELFQRLNEMISIEDEFVERISAMDQTNMQTLHLPVTSHLLMKSGLQELLDDSRRHREVLREMIKILSGDPRDEY
jgi:hypothetical protein